MTNKQTLCKSVQLLRKGGSEKRHLFPTMSVLRWKFEIYLITAKKLTREALFEVIELFELLPLLE